MLFPQGRTIMPVELIVCPSCGGRGSQYDNNKWACLKCGYKFIYTPPSEVTPQVAYQNPPPIVERTVTREVRVEVPTASHVPPLKRRSKLLWTTFILWLTSLVFMTWGINDQKSAVGSIVGHVGVLFSAVALLLAVYGLIRGLLRMLFARR